MASSKQNPLRMIGEQVQSILPRQNSDSHKHMDAEAAIVIQTLEKVPQIYQQFFRSHLAPGGTFPYTVLTPAYEVLGETVTAKLVCTIEHALYVLEEKENELIKVCYPIDEINTVEVIHRPSDLHVKVSGVTNLGSSSISVFGCSPTTSDVFSPLFQRIRLRIVSLNDKAPSRHMERLDRWQMKNTQVIDMARHCLMPGETLIEAILQPEIQPNIFSTDRAFRGPNCATHICILTDKELVMIREDLSLGKKDPGSTICNFVPLNKISSLAMTRESESLLTISIRLLNGELFESLFDVSLQKEVNHFLERTHELLPKERTYRRD